MKNTPAPPPPPKKEPPHLIAARTLEASLDSAKPPSQMLHTQAALLDALFAQLLGECLSTRTRADGSTYRAVREGEIDMALRAQKQCRQTLDAMAMRGPQTKTTNQTESP